MQFDFDSGQEVPEKKTVEKNGHVYRIAPGQRQTIPKGQMFGISNFA